MVVGGWDWGVCSCSTEDLGAGKSASKVYWRPETNGVNGQLWLLVVAGERLTVLGWRLVGAFLVVFAGEERHSVVGYRPISEARSHFPRFTAQATDAYHDKRDWEKYPVPNLGVKIERHSASKYNSA